MACPAIAIPDLYHAFPPSLLILHVYTAVACRTTCSIDDSPFQEPVLLSQPLPTMKLMTFLAKWLFFDNFSLGGGNGHPQDGRSFDLTLTWDKRAPDGFERDVILVNGQFPGPLLDMIQGQEVTVTVHNKLPFNTTVHFHGRFRSLLWSDIHLNAICMC